MGPLRLAKDEAVKSEGYMVVEDRQINLSHHVRVFTTKPEAEAYAEKRMEEMSNGMQSSFTCFVLPVTKFAFKQR